MFAKHKIEQHSTISYFTITTSTDRTIRSINPRISLYYNVKENISKYTNHFPHQSISTPASCGNPLTVHCQSPEPSKHSPWWRRLEDIFRLRLQKTSSRRLEDVLIKTNMFALALRLQKTSSRRLDQDEYVRLSLMSSEDVFKTSSRRLGQDQYICLGHMSSRRLQDVFKASSRLPAKISSRRFQGIFLRNLWSVYKISKKEI